MTKPYFLWDYNLNKDQIQAILNGSNEADRLWLAARILSHARFEDVWQYLKLKEVLSLFPKLRLKPQIREGWARAFNAWGYHVEPNK